jgi:phosphohistidine phosphatase
MDPGRGEDSYRDDVPSLFMELYILRHGKAEKKIPAGGSDADRQLTSRGIKDVKKIAGWLRSSGILLDVIGTSPLVRAADTAEIIARDLQNPRRPEVWESLEPGGDLDRLKKDIRASGSEGPVLIVGHEPMMSMLIGEMIAGQGNARVVLRTGALAMIGDIGNDEPLEGRLYLLIDPDNIIDRE